MICVLVISLSGTRSTNNMIQRFVISSLKYYYSAGGLRFILQNQYLHVNGMKSLLQRINLTFSCIEMSFQVLLRRKFQWMLRRCHKSVIGTKKKYLQTGK